MPWPAPPTSKSRTRARGRSACSSGPTIDTPTVAQALLRLLEGQNLNYAALFDLSGKRVTSLMILGVVPKSAAAPGPAAGGTRDLSRSRLREPPLPPVDDDPAEESEETPEPEPSPPSTAPVPRAGLALPHFSLCPKVSVRRTVRTSAYASVFTSACAFALTVTPGGPPDREPGCRPERALGSDLREGRPPAAVRRR